MSLVQFVRASLEMSFHPVLTLAEDMKDAPLTFPTPRGGNHPLWIMGHLASSEAAIVHQFAFGKPNSFEHWYPVFGPGTEPLADASKYPSYESVLQSFRVTREKSIELLTTLSDSDFDRPSLAPEQFKPFLGTIGGCFRAAINHTAVHMGQLADCRRAANRKPILFDPSAVESMFKENRPALAK